MAYAFKHEAVPRQEPALTIVLEPAAFQLGRNCLAIAPPIGLRLLVLVDELPNCAVEAVIDRHGEERNKLSATARNLASLSLCLVRGAWFALVPDRFSA